MPATNIANACASRRAFCATRASKAAPSSCKAQAVSRRDMFLSATLIGASVISASPAMANAVTVDADFIAETRALSDAITMYMSLDPFDKERIKALNYVKSEGKTWISKHAKGGSAPGQAAKRMYIAVDAVVGHLTANGAAPLPGAKVKFVKQALADVEALLEKGV